MNTSLHDHLKWLVDPRRSSGNKQHLLSDIIILTIIAVICGADSWDTIALFGKKKQSFLSKILKLPHGIPSHDTINRVISSLDSQHFNRLFIGWVNSIRDKSINKEVVAIDGKTLKGSKDAFHNQPAIHIVNAWANSNELVLGQLKTNTKSNEITAIPLLLDLLDIKDTIITIDAMGTQTAIAKTIIEAEADYILAVKGNQNYLYKNVINQFKNQTIADNNESLEKNKGRIETRICDVITDLTFLDDIVPKWKNLKSLMPQDKTRKRKPQNNVIISVVL